MDVFYQINDGKAYNYQAMITSFTTINKTGNSHVTVKAWKDDKLIEIKAPFSIEEMLEWAGNPENSDVMTEFFIKAYYQDYKAF
jgi:hypothetical protein